MSLVGLLDLLAVFVFALTGALTASRAQLDIVGFVFVACLTAMGGGTARDVILGREAVFWVADPAYVAVAGGAAILVFFTAHLIESRIRAVIWLDALAVAVAVPVGVAVARGMGFDWPVLLIMGMVTACIGGLARDVVCNEVPLVLKARDLYATAALAGAVANVLVFAAGGGAILSALACALLTFGIRAGSIALGWRAPVYRARPPRP
ncbi:trimeric intracellular cation channel family protein [Roseobacter sp. HKCCA0434]|uniref:trimeric intracellular cation channel family protein n=1 Tax=Roseobacter sp. HKCCA0434 TaxID=3079297 RepID=UPI0029058908|nr:TRIC cation channel family protein [Roseobacter sp. HKCCA0434]